MPIDIDDEKGLIRLVNELNLGFSAPTNGGIANSSIMILKHGTDENDPENHAPDGEDYDVSRTLAAAAGDLDRIKLEIENGLRGDQQIVALQRCVDALNDCIQQIGNNVTGNDQNAAYTGLGTEDPSASGPSQGDIELM